MSDLLAGFAKMEINPALGVRLGGYGIVERPAESINDNLYSSALVLEQEGIRCAIVSLDWLCVTADVVGQIKSTVNEKLKIPMDNIIVCAIHTHTAPNTMDIPGWGDVEYEYINSVMPAIIDSVFQAAAGLVPAKMGVGSIYSEVGVNRRTPEADGSVSFAGNSEGTFDPTMTVIRLIDMEDKPIVTMVHYGAHCTAWGLPRVVSRDWPGVMLDRLESQAHTPAMFVNGALGDVGPRTNTSQGMRPGQLAAGTGDGLESVLEVGYRGATDALKCYSAIMEFEDSVVLSAANADIQVPVNPLPDIAEVNAKLEELEPFKDEWGAKMCQYQYWGRVLKAHSEPLKDTITIESRIIAFGSVAFVTLPAEPFSSVSLRLRDASPYSNTLLLSNANGSLAYIVDANAREIGGYEVGMASAILTYIPVNNVDEVIVATSADNLNKMKQTQG